MNQIRLRLISGVFVICILVFSIFFVFNPHANTTSDELETQLMEQEALEMIENLYTDISTYLSIDSILGYYLNTGEDRIIHQIAIQFHPKFSTALQLSEIFIELSDGTQELNLLISRLKYRCRGFQSFPMLLVP